jgi:hypothetical protein
MGLDITAYSNLKPVGLHADGWCDDEEHVMAYAYNCFPASFRGLPELGAHTSFMLGGCFAITAETETIRFQAGSYPGYNVWRADLARQFNPTAPGAAGPGSFGEPDPNEPFYELIWFADNEGCIGPDAARDLLADFEQHAAEYRPGRDRDYFAEKYADWTIAFRLAADSGLVHFH